MNCKNCKKSFPADELDSIVPTEEDRQRDTYTSDDDAGVCYACANDDPYYNPDHTAMIKELLENTMNGLAAARKESPTKTKADLVAEHVHKNPEKYLKEIVRQATTKKKNGPTRN